MQEATKIQAIRQFRAHDGVLRTAEALRLGIHPRTLYQLREEGLIEAISRGVYRLADLPPLAHPDLVTVALRVPKAIVCLISALSFHEITSEVPHEVQVALPRGTKKPKIDHPPLRVFRFSEPGLSLGVQTVKLDGIDVRIYDPAKTVVDCFRYRNKLGVDVAIEALKLCIERKLARPADLLRYARKCRAERVMLPYIEALQ